MPDPVRRSSLSDKEWEIVNTIRQSNAVNFDEIGKIVAEVGPKIFDPGVAADDYIAKGYSSVVQVWKVGLENTQLENLAQLRQIAERISP